MQPVFAIASNITTSLGLNTTDVWNAVMAGNTGIRQHNVPELSAAPFWASRIADAQWLDINASIENNKDYTPFETMAIYSVKDALAQCSSISKEETILILATTKGNIEGLNEDDDERNLLTTSAGLIGKAVGLSTNPIIVSHACVSGVMALQYGLALLQNGRYKNAIVVGADRFTKFVLSGFQSFQAVADEPCKPFDVDRKGINLGEAAATIVLSRDNTNALAQLCSGATSNDANHISGPSRTGHELGMAINSTLKQAGIGPRDVNMISAHGTATLYNDEMESKAFAMAGLTDVDAHSMKGYLGHTLGAAGVLESVMCMQALCHQKTIPSAGFTTLGVPEPINITRETAVKALEYILKTASGFGGCNAVVLWARA